MATVEHVIVPRRATRRLNAGRLSTYAAIVVLAVFVIAAIFGPLISPYDPIEVGVGEPLAGPSSSHLLGTDQLGRDVLSRIIAAARIALLAAVQSVAIAAVAGCVLGIIAAYFRRAADFVVLRLADFLFSFPEFLLAVIIIAALGPGLSRATLAIGIVYTPRFIRISRVQAVLIMQSGYVEASRLAGRSGAHIMFRHVLPNVATPVVIITALSLATAQLAYAGLSFLGFGARPPTPDYGQMVADARTYMLQEPLLAIAPAVALVLIVLGFAIVGDAVRDKLDPRSTAGHP